MEFGELRSKLHNGEEIFWKDLELLSECENYEGEIVPYLSGFDPHWKKRTLREFFKLDAFFHAVETFPFAYFGYFETTPMFDEEDFQDARFLQLREISFTKEQLQRSFANSPYMRNVEVLKLSRDPQVPIYVGGTFFSTGRLWSNLPRERRDIISSYTDLRSLFESPHLKSLKEIYGLYDAEVGDLKVLLEGPLMETLEKLEVGCDDEEALLIASSPRVSQLKYLDVSRYDLLYDTTKALVTSPYLKNLKVLKLPPHSKLFEEKLVACNTLVHTNLHFEDY